MKNLLRLQPKHTDYCLFDDQRLMIQQVRLKSFGHRCHPKYSKQHFDNFLVEKLKQPKTNKKLFILISRNMKYEMQLLLNIISMM